MDPRADLSLHCSYCGRDDQLPVDELSRALELRERVRLAAGSVSQLDGVQAALAHIFEDRAAFFRLTMPWLVVGAFVTFYQLVNGWPIIARSPAAYRFGFALYAAMGTLWISGIALSFVIALSLGRLSYRRNVRPLLQSRPPRVPGQPLRCRGCGADLPDERGPLVRCRFCSTHNLVSAHTATESTALLLAEERAYRDRAAQASRATAAAAPKMTRMLAAGMVASYVLMFVLAKLAASQLPH